MKKILEIYTNLELKDQLYAIFYTVSASLSLIGLILGLIFQVEFWMNIPHIILILMCLFLPILLSKSITEITEWIMLVGAVFYLPFVFITNGGYEGAAPIYFVMIVIFYAFHFKGKRLAASVAFLNLYYVTLITWTFFHPEIIVPYPDDICRLIDICVAVASVSTVMVIVSYAAFNGYKMERQNVYDLMEELTAQNKALKDLSIRDQLTGLFTKKYFLDKLSEELQTLELKSFKFYVLMIDIDYFKKINDTHGHLFGDEVLKQVARVMGENIRSIDIAARYGGEEFILLLTHSYPKQGLELAERIRKCIEALTFRYDVKITASIGVSISRQKDSAESIIERADSELYKAKNSGRNRVFEWQEKDLN